MNLFYLRNDKSYSYLVEAIKLDLKKKYNKDVNAYYFQNPKFKLKSLLFVLKQVLILRIFDNEKIYKIEYKKIHIGQYSLARCLRNPNSYYSKFFKILYILNYLIKSVNLVDYSFKIVQICDAIYIDHPMYLNGIVYSIFSKNKKIIYSNNAPKGLFVIDYSLKKNSKKIDIKDSLKFSKKLFFKHNDINLKKINVFFNNPKNIPWLRNTKFKKKFDLTKNLNNVEYIIYAHSFLDGVIFYGYDGFLDLRDWLEFTIEKLIKKNSKVIIKGHPNFYNNIFGEISRVDKYIFDKFISKYRNCNNLLFFNEAINNHFFLKNFSNKKTIIISHHGSITIEASIAGFKTICSNSTFWDNTFKISNQWNSRDSYNELLRKDWNDLKNVNSKDLMTLSNQVFAEKNDFGNKLWTEVINKNLRHGNRPKNKILSKNLISKALQKQSINELKFI